MPLFSLTAFGFAVIVSIVLIRKTRELRAMRLRFSPIIETDKELERLQKARKELEQTVQETRASWSVEFEKTIAELAGLQGRVEWLNELANMQEFGLYEPIFDYDTSERYKEAVLEVRAEQKTLVKNEQAAVCDIEWAVEGSKAKGRDMIRRYTKLQIRAFNGECDAAIAKARFDNVTQLESRIEKSWDAINALGKTNQVRITVAYRDLKLKELRLAYELARKKQQEKEERQAINAEMREEELARKEMEKAKKEAEKDETRYAKALEQARKELEVVEDEQKEALKRKIGLLEKQFEDAHDRKTKAISRAQLTKSGHVYIISNSGSFGNDIFKIGMTRRLEPLDRVKELGGASVPFRFDVHAMVYAEDAPALESELHRRFAPRQINRVNNRREFFRVSLDEIEVAVKELCGEETEFVRVAVAEEYRESEALRRKEELALEAKQQDRVDAEVAQARQRLEELRETWKATPIG